MAGDDCSGPAKTTCGIGLACVRGKCLTIVAVNQTCDEVTTTCVEGSVCVRPMRGANGTCTLAVRTAGDACSIDAIGMPSCNVAVGLFCDQSGHCAGITFAPPGSPCGIADAGTSVTSCTDGADCIAGMCIARLPPGAVCTAGMAPFCSADTSCVATGGSKTGNCLYLNSSNCH
jgi:hypothetical protein